MSPFGVPVSNSNSISDAEFYVFYSTVENVQDITDKIVLVVYGIAVVLSIFQTFVKNKRFDRLLTSIDEIYSGRKLQSIAIDINERRIQCYQYGERYSYIPYPNRSILFIICTHIQILILIAIRALITQKTEIINDCYAFHYPYEVLICENKSNPCLSNQTDINPKCTYYHFESTNLITMVTTIVTWHAALRYLIVRSIHLIRWIIFRNDDHPRLLFHCCQSTICIFKGIMYIYYFILWLYTSALVTTGFFYKKSLFRLILDHVGYIWAPIVLAGDRIGTLALAFNPELIQNWLDATSNGILLEVIDSTGISLANVQPLLHLTNKNLEKTRL